MTDPAAANDQRPILVVPFPAVGDFVRCQSLLRLLKQREPQRPIDVLARAPAVELARFMPEVSLVFTERFGHWRLDCAARWALARDIRRRGHATAYVLQNSFKAAVIPFLAGIPERIGWSAECRYPLINRMRFGWRRVPRMVDSACLLACPGDTAVPEAWPEPRLILSDDLRQEVAALRAQAPAGMPLVALAPGSSGPAKNWPAARYAALAAALAVRGMSVWVVGAPWERGLCETICAAAPEARDMIDPSLTRTALAIAAADVFVGNDSGPLHIAAAFGRPSIGIFCATSPGVFAPINDNLRIVQAARRVARPRRGEVHHPEVAEVLAALEMALGAPPPRLVPAA